MSTLRTARRFVAAALGIAPRQAAEVAAITLVLTATEGIGLLLLIPLLQLVGLDMQAQGAIDDVVATLAAWFGVLGLRPSLGLVLGIYVAILWTQALLQRRQMCLSALVEQKIVTRLRTRVYDAITGAKWIYVARTRSSDYVQILTEEVDRVGTAAFYAIDIVVTMAIAAVYVGFAFRVSAPMTAVVLVCGALLALTMRGSMAQARAAGEAWTAASARFHAAVAEHLASLKIAKAYEALPRHSRMFAGVTEGMNEVGMTTVRVHARFRQTVVGTSAAVLAAVVYLAYTVVALSTGQLLLLLFLFARLVPRLTGLYEKLHVLATALPAFDAVIEAERRCLAAAESPPSRAHAVDLNDRIELDRVTFDYREDGRSPALRDATLTIPAGATTAVVGPSGSGKSTLADLLMGLLRPAAGRILIDGVPLDADRIRAWRERIGYVAQDTFLFHDSVRANLLWARPDASEEDLWRALRLAAADECVAALPAGLDTVVGDRGVLVSGGERQRLSLARALLRQPTLLILDEATSSLDSENEARIQRAIEQLHQQMTIVIITHRLSTIRGADLIHVLDQGRLVESGTWDELTARSSGRFRKLCRAQGLNGAASVTLGTTQV